jgi:hypothetical protein
MWFCIKGGCGSNSMCTFSHKWMPEIKVTCFRGVKLILEGGKAWKKNMRKITMLITKPGIIKLVWKSQLIIEISLG